jgi:hypothetical protein
MLTAWHNLLWYSTCVRKVLEIECLKNFILTFCRLIRLISSFALTCNSKYLRLECTFSLELRAGGGGWCATMLTPLVHRRLQTYPSSRILVKREASGLLRCPLEFSRNTTFIKLGLGTRTSESVPDRGSRGSVQQSCIEKQVWNRAQGETYILFSGGSASDKKTVLCGTMKELWTRTSCHQDDRWLLTIRVWLFQRYYKG